MNYIGSKYSLLPEIEKLLKAHVPPGGVALDLFAGSGAMAQLLKSLGYVTYANDWQYYSYLTNVSFIALNAFPTFDTLLAEKPWRQRISSASERHNLPTYSIFGRNTLSEDLPCAQVLRYLNQLCGARGPFYEAYCGGGAAGRLYYSSENGLRIQAIRDQIESWGQPGLISAQEKAWLVACLIEAADRIANTASVYGAFLKHVKKSAQKPMTLVALQPSPSPHSAEQHRVFCEDGIELLKRFEPGQLRLVYVDPPYNHRQYSANYHILETIARWDMDQFTPRGVTGLRKAAEQRSDYSLRSSVRQAFQQLFEQINSEYLLFSYNNEGLLTRREIKSLFDAFCSEFDFFEIKFKRFRADVDRDNRVYKTDHTFEFLVLGKPKRSLAK